MARELLESRLANARSILTVANETIVCAPIHAEALLMSLSRSFYSPEAAAIAQTALCLSQANRTALEGIFQVRRS